METIKGADAYKPADVESQGADTMIKRCICCGESKWQTKWSKNGVKQVAKCEDCGSIYKLIFMGTKLVSCYAMLEFPEGTRVGDVDINVITDGGPYSIDGMVPLEGTEGIKGQ